MSNENTLDILDKCHKFRMIFDLKELQPAPDTVWHSRSCGLPTTNTAGSILEFSWFKMGLATRKIGTKPEHMFRFCFPSVLLSHQAWKEGVMNSLHGLATRWTPLPSASRAPART